MMLLPLLLASTGDLMPWSMVERNLRLLSRLGMPSTSIACAAAVIPLRQKYMYVFMMCLLRGGLTIEVDNRNKQMTVHRRLGKPDNSLEITDGADEDAT